MTLVHVQIGARRFRRGAAPRGTDTWSHKHKRTALPAAGPATSRTEESNVIYTDGSRLNITIISNKKIFSEKFQFTFHRCRRRDILINVPPFPNRPSGATGEQAIERGDICPKLRELINNLQT